MASSPQPIIGLYQPYPHSFGGVQAMVIKLAKTLPGFGYQPLVISPEEGSFTNILRKQNLPFHVSDPGPAWHVYGRGANSLSYLFSPARVVNLLRYWRHLSIDLRQHHVSLLHCNDYRGVMLAAPAARLARIPVIWHMHGFIASPIANLLAAALVEWTVPVSRGMLDYLRIPRWLFGKYEVINNGIENPTPAHPPAQPAPDDPPLVLAVGSLHPRKGYETLIRAFTHVTARIPTAQCWIVGAEFGDGAYAKELRALIQQLHLTQHVKLIGHSDDVPSLLRRCRLLTVPSRVEAFGMVAIEAMLAGKPVVACRTGGLPEIIQDRLTGRLIEPQNAAAMGQAIIEILSNQTLAEQMGAAGQHRALEKFTLNKMTASFAQFYGTLLNQA